MILTSQQHVGFQLLLVAYVKGREEPGWGIRYGSKVLYPLLKMFVGNDR